ncbi:MAG: DUF402 domain-containing protein [Firmicutes bacterium]|nr:DUF402 domain-containing protein [Bacillota bacterium]
MSPAPTLIRRRFIPDETITLHDEVLRADGEVVLTRWKTLSPVHAFDGGRSCYFLNRGFKLSRFYRDGAPFDYIYCDLIETSAAPGGYVFTDLLIDVLVYDSGFVKILDVGEVCDALDRGLIGVDTAKKAMRLLDGLLGIIYSGGFGELARMLE